MPAADSNAIGAGGRADFVSRDGDQWCTPSAIDPGNRTSALTQTRRRLPVMLFSSASFALVFLARLFQKSALTPGETVLPMRLDLLEKLVDTLIGLRFFFPRFVDP